MDPPHAQSVDSCRFHGLSEQDNIFFATQSNDGTISTWLFIGNSHVQATSLDIRGASRAGQGSSASALFATDPGVMAGNNLGY